MRAFVRGDSQENIAKQVIESFTVCGVYEESYLNPGETVTSLVQTILGIFLRFV